MQDNVNIRVEDNALDVAWNLACVLYGIPKALRMKPGRIRHFGTRGTIRG